MVVNEQTIPRRARVARVAAQGSPLVVWRAFIDLLASSRVEQLTATQQVAFHAFWYDIEVQNGGHDQLFSNRGGELAALMALSLEQLGAVAQADLLREAASRWGSRRRLRTAELEAHLLGARTGEFADLDALYGECEPAIPLLLKEYLQTHEDHFIEFRDDV